MRPPVRVAGSQNLKSRDQQAVPSSRSGVQVANVVHEVIDIVPASGL